MSQPSTQQPEQSVVTDNPTSKKRYHAPHIEDYGCVTSLTRTGSSFSITEDGGATFPNIYVSGPN
jgi:hypothetical protein